MAQKKVERNVFIHYNVRLRLRNMKRARNQGEQEQYCPINLDYIFAEDDPLLPWLEHREKEKDVANSEEENYPDLVQRTAQTTQEEVIEVQGDSSATQSDPSHDGGEEDDDDDDDDDGDNGDGGGGGGSGGGIGSTSETFVPSIYPYPHSSMSEDRGKSPMIEEEEEEEEGEDEDEGEEDEDESGMHLIERRSPWPSGYPNVYSETVYSQHPPQPPPVPTGAGSFSYFFGYPPQYGYGYGHTNYNTNTNTNNDDDDNIEEPPRHSFWW